MRKPTIKFCWVCSRKLYGNHHRKIVFKGDGREKTVHVQCADEVNDEKGR